MVQPHPHGGATYRMIARKDGAFQVEVTLPDTAPITMTNFARQADAQRWIDRHKASVNAGRPLHRPPRGVQQQQHQMRGLPSGAQPGETIAIGLAQRASAARS
jgi:hypothetical protein